MTAKAFICGVAGPALSAEEQAFLTGESPWGLILFRRNCREAAQIADLVAGFRAAVGRPDAPVLIDQEGGRVQRLAPPQWPAYPAAAAFGRIEAVERGRGERAAWLGARLIAADLAVLGITVDCLPVLDRPVPGAHDIIGDRAYAGEVDTIARLGRATAAGLMAGGVLPVVKHVPGHGRAGADSHHGLPAVDAPRAELEATDFAPFAALADMPMAMTAHVVYTALDPDRPATTSPRVVGEVIRGTIGYDGLVMTDDLSMQALSGSFAERARLSLAAGCDIVLHCNGVMEEMRAVAASVPLLAGAAQRRAAAALGRLHAPEPFDAVRARAELGVHLAASDAPPA